MRTEEEFRAELAELGEEKFRLKYGPVLTAAVIAALDRTQAGEVAEERIQWWIVVAVIVVGVTALGIPLLLADMI